MPQPFLPPFEAFQGSRLPYWRLLPVQLVILGAMVRFAWRVQTDRLAQHRRLGLWLVWAGAVYMAFALGRIAVGLAAPDAHAWFRTWVPAFFLVVLAAFVLVVSIYHLRERASTTGRER